MSSHNTCFYEIHVWKFIPKLLSKFLLFQIRIAALNDSWSGDGSQSNISLRGQSTKEAKVRHFEVLNKSVLFIFFFLFLIRMHTLSAEELFNYVILKCFKLSLRNKLLKSCVQVRQCSPFPTPVNTRLVINKSLELSSSKVYS